MDIFISYSHKDHAWKERIGVFMQCMRRQGHFDYNTWDDGEINLSEHWERRIEEAIKKAKIAILLISPDFLTSRFIIEKELPLLLRRKEEGFLTVVPVIIRPSPWEVVDWLAPIQLHPTGGQALSGGTEHEIENHLKSLTIEVHRLHNQSKNIASSDDQKSISNAEPEETEVYKLLSESSIRELIHRQFSEEVIDTLLLYEVTGKQKVWLVTTRSKIYCLIDSKKVSGRRVQWEQLIEPGLQVVARTNSRIPSKAGTVDIGIKQNWLYSLKKFPNPDDLKTQIDQLIERALHS